MMGTLSSQELHRWLERGVSNVAYVSLALGLDNLVSRTFVEERVCRERADLDHFELTTFLCSLQISLVVDS